MIDIFNGFHMNVLAYDLYPNENLDAVYVSLDELFEKSDVISLHCPLTKETRHIINEDSINKMKPGVILSNTSRGALIDSTALIAGLKSGKIGAVALDVYEEEEGVFYEDVSNEIILENAWNNRYFLYAGILLGVIVLCSLIEVKKIYHSLRYAGILLACFIVSGLLLLLSDYYTNLPVWVLGGIVAAALVNRNIGMLYLCDQYNYIDGSKRYLYEDKAPSVIGWIDNDTLEIDGKTYEVSTYIK
jgi:hypothetical protein